MTIARKPRVVSLGEPAFVGNEYLAQFKTEFDYSVLPATNREETQTLLPKDIKENGPIDGFIIRIGTPPYESFDGDLLRALKIVFCNTVNAVAEATADMAIFLTLAVLRNTTNAEQSARSGMWRKGANLVPTCDPSGLTLGIVGMGAIGKYLAKKAAVFNMKIKYYNRHQLPASEETAYDATYCKSLHDLLREVDVVSLNCPLNAATTNLISKAEFSAMKNGVFLVNTARGAVIDEEALIAALESGKVQRAGLDVFVNEPSPNPYFLQSDKVVVQPHLGGLTEKAFQKAERECFENIRAFFKTGKANSPVNIKTTAP
ncbi:D-isomer specific 2-hydroxyacid dehydrogenase NAD-binding [Penicillium cf. griseofulvum]|uniref:D-isomer specific 2-hydroxyacid dehydrogenase NAD-binding n=1 Tax=Penicillium cf. griseofulvum TaxID=2972120 RepID=A0A9W9JNS7_9EURO|nr:D-isomer specific 2-hydroxyacid dehydrogenase NAD-binding [Penicillium cf. griseofulvum]KAJ5442182.1 D-isomer specific 2-hydroxyacid dehydrogenase NAD-binding [Penicillium cf. griseofulvum]KAJ5450845.1 D-isomer specific 2-hydroxyacid dehydrogenase NAD-binding [Penicillium cf. griseofulvum]